jgi:hypothetical protein
MVREVIDRAGALHSTVCGARTFSALTRSPRVPGSLDLEPVEPSTLWAPPETPPLYAATALNAGAPSSRDLARLLEFHQQFHL